MYSPGHLRERSRELVLARTWGVAAIGAILAGVFLESELDRLQESLLEARTIAYFALLAVTGGLLFLWIWATERELDLLFKWLDPKDWSVPSDLSATATILGFAVVLTSLLLTARDPMVYGAIFTVYSVGILFAVRRLNRQLAAAFKASYERLDDDQHDPALAERTAAYRRGVEILQEYFLQQPHTARHLAIFTASSGGLLLAVWARDTESTAWAVAAYAVFIATICSSEGQITRWRNRRDSALMKPESTLHELGRAAPVEA